MPDDEILEPTIDEDAELEALRAAKQADMVI